MGVDRTKKSVEAVPDVATPDADASKPAESGATPPLMWVRPSSGSGDRGYVAAHDVEFSREYPVLTQFLTLAGHGGAQRVTGSLLLFCEDGKWKACLSDRDEGYYAFCSADSFTGLLGALEKGLKSGSLDWRVSKNKRPGR